MKKSKSVMAQGFIYLPYISVEKTPIISESVEMWRFYNVKKRKQKIEKIKAKIDEKS